MVCGGFVSVLTLKVIFDFILLTFWSFICDRKPDPGLPSVNHWQNCKSWERSGGLRDHQVETFLIITIHDT